MNKTILDYEEATSIAPDDYIVMDSAGGGTSKILASTFGDHEPEPDYLYKWDFTKSLTDEIGGKVAKLTNATRTSEGVIFNAAEQRLALFGSNEYKKLAGYTWEFDIAKFDFKGNKDYHIRFLNLNYGSGTIYGLHPLTFRANTNIGWSAYGCSSATWNKNNRGWSGVWSNDLSGNADAVINSFNEKTVKMVFGSDSKTMSLYINNVLIATKNDYYFEPSGSHKLTIGALDTYSMSQSSGDQCYDMIISEIRIYENL